MKTVNEITLEIDDQPGALSGVSELLTGNGIYVLAIAVHTNGTAGHVSLLVSDPERTQQVLTAAGYQSTRGSVIAARVPSHPGGFNTVLRVIKNAGVNIERLYTAMDRTPALPEPLLVLRVDDVAVAEKALDKEWIGMITEQEALI
jgi:hypothetical protein